MRWSNAFFYAGALAQRYEELGGDVLYYGKPYPPIYDACLHLIGDPDPARVLAIGDSLRTDIAGAAAVGMDSILVLGGIHGEAFASGDSRQRRNVENKIAEACAADGNFPIAAIAEFSW